LPQGGWVVFTAHFLGLWRNKVMTDVMIDVAVIGAGMAGLSCARRLADAGRQVVVFDKSRGVGGRMATRRNPHDPIDHGAPFFMAVDPAFCAQVNQWQQAGVVAEWAGRFVQSDAPAQWQAMPLTPRYVGLPRMSALGRHVLGDGVCHTQHRLTALTDDGTSWQLSFDGQPIYTARHVVLALPAPQLAALWPVGHHWHQLGKTIAFAPTWVVMLHFSQSLQLPFEGCDITHGPLMRAICNSHKPARQASPTQGESWVLHASPAWSHAHVDTPAAAVEAMLLHAWAELTGRAVADLVPTQVMSHRWLYAVPDRPSDRLYDWNAGQRVGVAGDWLCGTTVASAWQSGLALADVILQ